MQTVMWIEQDSNMILCDNPTVTIYCTNSSSVCFLFSQNVTMEGVTCQGCGYNNCDSFLEVTVQSYTFNDSVGQVMSLPMMSRDVTINNCQFTNNCTSKYNGEGVAVYCMPKSTITATATPLQIDRLKVWSATVCTLIIQIERFNVALKILGFYESGYQFKSQCSSLWCSIHCFSKI